MESGALVLVLGGHVGVVREEQRDKVQEAVRRREHERGLAGLVQGRKEGRKVSKVYQRRAKQAFGTDYSERIPRG